MSKVAEDFFYKHAGYGQSKGETKEQARRRSAKALAAAEVYASTHGWRTEWEDDPEGWNQLGDIDPSEVHEVLSAVLRDQSGRVLGSLGSVTFGRNSVENRQYGRVVEAELALEAMPRRKR